MSTQAIGAPLPTAPAGELAAASRIRELQQLIESARGVATGTTPAAGSSTTAAPTAFAAALQAAVAPTSSSGALPAEGSGSSSYNALIEQAALRNGLDPAVLHGLIQQESDFNPSAQSAAGASGLTQLMPGTASSLGVSNPLDPAQSIEGGPVTSAS